MAYDFIDCIGDDVDVVSDSEVGSAFPYPFLSNLFLKYGYGQNFFFVCFLQNIKKLLKIPYSKSHVSMAVHRVGRTLLLDELDTQELLRRSSQVQGDMFYLFDSVGTVILMTTSVN